MFQKWFWKGVLKRRQVGFVWQEGLELQGLGEVVGVEAAEAYVGSNSTI